MLDNKLNELGKYAEEIEKKDPEELVNEYLKDLIKDVEKSSDESVNLGNEFGREIVEIIDKYKRKGISDIQISYHMLSLLVCYIKRSLIEEKAAMLDIDKNLYKNKMHFLFKGK